MSRTVIVGDVHGCCAELQELLARVGFSDDDHLYFVGDLVGRGPDTLGVLALAQQLGAVAVRGNHEQKLLSFVQSQREGGPLVRLGPGHLQLVHSLSEQDWAWLEAMPLWHDLPEHDLRIVHAGVKPGVPIEATDTGILLTIRAITQRGQASITRGGEPWARWYHGPPHIVFGHNALMHPQLHPWATGIDLGCVYGGFLAALVLGPGQTIPSIEERQELLVSVSARRAYYPVRKNYGR
ncbi:MAG TPA: metallophosphoesterase [Polyangiaceae bacterium]|jgi:hypothetical protein|nr:MAG: Bis(5'-nucleosyl)-tetraphosphatase PrpE (asymmetrical) [Deltaproteobacteria bacterium ADurb.Bin207]HNZ22163.1 metallophosphoesterase [Polyangiaceae bacterium]HOD21341.1 metallophosphoesterase [Polyangiaceae bacterium]HOE46987.1 metallophosphoesterase [Polyangiaceae bacterium]HOG99832.1 metallophosphoesterase [Polyangiaceae bacterium]